MERWEREEKKGGGEEGVRGRRSRKREEQEERVAGAHNARQGSSGPQQSRTQTSGLQVTSMASVYQASPGSTSKHPLAKPPH